MIFFTRRGYEILAILEVADGSKMGRLLRRSLDGRRKGKLEKKLGRAFARPELLADALTHPSLGGEKGKRRSHRRLMNGWIFGRPRFGLVVAAWLYEIYPVANEGELQAACRACQPRRSQKSRREIGLESALRLAHGETVGKGRKNLTSFRTRWKL